MSYNEIIESVQFDDPVHLLNVESGIYVNGYVRDYFASEPDENGAIDFYISLYSFSTRIETIYILDEKCVLKPVKFSQETIISEVLDDVSSEQPESPVKKNTITHLITKIILLILIFSMITGGIDFSQFFINNNLTYSRFLTKKYSITQLSSVVRNRVKYVKDYQEVWHKPDFAWKNKFGDCEEYAAIITDYLVKNNIEAYIVTINLKSGGGHAFSVAIYDNSWWIIDPLQSAEKMGVRNFSKKMSINDIFLLYSNSSGIFYRVPQWNGDKTTLVYPNN